MRGPILKSLHSSTKKVLSTTGGAGTCGAGGLDVATDGTTGANGGACAPNACVGAAGGCGAAAGCDCISYIMLILILILC